jgi:hypothetical protein
MKRKSVGHFHTLAIFIRKHVNKIYDNFNEGKKKKKKKKMIVPMYLLVNQYNLTSLRSENSQVCEYFVHFLNTINIRIINNST